MENERKIKKYISILCLVVMFCIGVYFIGQFFFDRLSNDKLSNNKPEDNYSSSTNQSTNETEKKMDGFATAEELDAFLSGTSWECDGEGDIRKEGLQFDISADEDYKMFNHLTLQDDIGCSGIAYSYLINSGTTLVIDAASTQYQEEIPCLVSADRKYLTLGEQKYKKVKSISWFEM